MSVVYAYTQWDNLYLDAQFREMLHDSVGAPLYTNTTKKQQVYVPADNYFTAGLHDERHVKGFRTPANETPLSDPLSLRDKNGRVLPCDTLGVGFYGTQVPNNTHIDDIRHIIFAAGPAPVMQDLPKLPPEVLVDTFDGDTLLRVVAAYPCLLSKTITKDMLTERVGLLHARLKPLFDDGKVVSQNKLHEYFEASRMTHRAVLPMYFGSSTVRNHITVVREDMQATIILDQGKQLRMKDFLHETGEAPRRNISSASMPTLFEDADAASMTDRVFLIVETSIPSLSRYLHSTLAAQNLTLGQCYTSQEYAFGKAVAVVNNMRVAALAVEVLAGDSGDMQALHTGTAEKLSQKIYAQKRALWHTELHALLHKHKLIAGDTPVVGPSAISMYNTLNRLPTGDIVYSRNMAFQASRPNTPQLLFCGPLNGYILYDFVEAAYAETMQQRPQFMADMTHGQAKAFKDVIVEQMFFPRDIGRVGHGLKVIEPRHLSHVDASGHAAPGSNTVLYSAYASSSLRAQAHVDPFFAAYTVYGKTRVQQRNAQAIANMLIHERPVEYYIPRAYTDVLLFYVGKPALCFRKNVYPTFAVQWHGVFNRGQDSICMPRNSLIVSGVAQLVLKGDICVTMAEVFQYEDLTANTVVLNKTYVELACRHLFQLPKQPDSDYVTCCVWRGTASEIA